MKLYDGREKFYQYDTNQKLICEDCAVGEEIHFSNSAHGDAAICLTYDLDGVVVVDVPNLYLLSASELNVYSMRTEDDGRCTISRHVFGVIPRKKPSDYVYEETEVKSYSELDRRIKKLEENSGAGIDITGAAAGQIPQIAEVDENGEPTKWQPADLPAVAAMTGATAETAGASGLVPAPAAGDGGKFLRGDGTWGEIDIPEGGGVVINGKQYEVFDVVTVDNAETTLFDFSTNAAGETLESKQYKEVFVYSNHPYTSDVAVIGASVIINDMYESFCSHFNRDSGGYLFYRVFIEEGCLCMQLRGLDSDNHSGLSVLMGCYVDGVTGRYKTSAGGKFVQSKFSHALAQFGNGIVSVPKVDFIKRFLIQPQSACRSGVTFTVYGR